MPSREDTNLFIPQWAIRAISGQLEVGAHLATRDGRRTGNAHIIATGPAGWNHTVTLYDVLTDAGNTMRLTAGEVDELFYPPQWVSDVQEVIRKFGHNLR